MKYIKSFIVRFESYPLYTTNCRKRKKLDNNDNKLNTRHILINQCTIKPSKLVYMISKQRTEYVAKK